MRDLIYKKIEEFKKIKEYFPLFLNNLNRKVTNIFFAEKLYLYWLLISILLFIVGGSIFILPGILQKGQLISQMREANLNMYTKSEALIDLRKDLQEADPYIPYINLLVSDKLSTQDYMVDYFVLVSNQGYSVDRFNPVVSTSDNTVVEVSSKIVGKGNVSKVINDLESLRRVTSISEVDYVKNRLGDDYINLKITIFNL